MKYFRTALIGALNVGLLLALSLPVFGQAYKIRDMGTLVGYLRQPVDAMLPLMDSRPGSERPAMSMNFQGQFVTGSVNGNPSYIVLPAPAYGKSAGFHQLPVGFVPYAINNFGQVAGILVSNQMVAVWTNGPALRILGSLPGYSLILNVDINFRGVVVGTAKQSPVASSVACAAFIAGPADTNLTKLFPDVEGSTLVARINSSADVVGMQYPTSTASGPSSSFVTQGGDTLRPGTIQSLDNLDGSGAALFPELINNWGDVAGLRALRGDTGLPLANTREIFTFNPGSPTDLPKKFGGYSPRPAEVFALNARAQLLCYSNYVHYFFQSGSFQRMEQLVAVNSGWSPSTGWPTLAGVDLNDNGWILGVGNYQGQNGHVFMMIPAGLDARASVTPTQVALGAAVTYSVTLSNATPMTGVPLTLSTVRPILHPSDDVGLATLVDGPSPSDVAALAPGQTATFTYTLKSVLPGPTRLFSQGAAYNPTARTLSFTNLFSEHVFATLQIAGLSGTMDATPRRVSSNDVITVTITARNQGSTAMTAVAPTAISVEGTGGAAVLTGPVPTSISTLAPGAVTNFQYTFRAGHEGSINFRARLAGTTSGGARVETGDLVSPIVAIAPRGDLLIKRGVESEGSYALDDVYQTVPTGLQVRTNAVSRNDVSEFQVRIQNDDPQPRIFRLASIESTNAGWAVKYLWQDQDITAQMRAFLGAEFPALASSETLTVTVQMTPTNAALGDLKRIRFALSSPVAPTETLDSVEAVTETAMEIVVNSTADLPDLDPNDCCCDTGRRLTNGVPECTLRAAIQLANKHPGKDIIKFAIPANDPNSDFYGARIEPLTDLPAVEDSVVLDGWSQNANAETPPIYLSGYHLPRTDVGWGLGSGWPSDGRGLEFKSENNEVRGFVVSQFSFGIVFLGGRNVLQGCFIGTDPLGLHPKANGFNKYLCREPVCRTNFVPGAGVLVRSESNLIGGIGARVRNVLSGQFQTIEPPGGPAPKEINQGNYITSPNLVLEGLRATGNRIEGNIIGLNRYGTATLGEVLPAAPHWVGDRAPHAGVLINNASDNVVGGTQPGAGNVIADNVHGIALIRGSENNRVLGNSIGADIYGTHEIQNLYASILIYGASRNRIGSTAPGAGNTMLELIDIVGPNAIANVVEGNRIMHATYGVHLFEAQGTLVISNRIVENGYGAYIQGLNAVSNSIVGNFIYSNDFGIFIAEGNCRITQNSIFATKMPPGIDLHAPGDIIVHNNVFTEFDNALTSLLDFPVPMTARPITPNDSGDFDSGPNALQNYPVLFPVNLSSGVVRGLLGTLPGARVYRIELFANRVAPHGHGEGEMYLGYVDASTDLSGDATFTFPLPGNLERGWFMTATATDPGGNTSEFSKAVQICNGTDRDLDGICDELEAMVPASPQLLRAGMALRSPQAATAMGDGNGDGVPDADQPNVTSIRTVTGNWITLASAAGLPLSNVSAEGPPPPVLPDGFQFPWGFVAVTITGIAPGNSVTLTNFIQDNRTVTAAFIYYPNTTNVPAHWTRLNVAASGAQVRLTLQDGGEGDTDGVVNGQVTTLFGLAVPVAQLPALTLLRSTPITLSTLAITNNPDGTQSLVTNIVSARENVLAWPDDGTDSYLQFTDQLIPTNLWISTRIPAAVSNQSQILTNYSADSSRFYRLLRY